jgi:hypothetical protein
MESGRICRTGTPGNAEPQLGEARESRMKSNPPSWGLAFPETAPAHSPLASRRDNKAAAPSPPGNAEPQLGKASESRMKSHSPSWGLAFPGNRL